MLLDAGGVEKYTPGQVLLRRGETAGHVVLVLTGAVKVRADDGPALLGVVSAGDLVGEMAVLDGGPRSATVLACGPVLARVISCQHFQVLLRTRFDLLVALAQVNADRLRRSNELRRARHGPAEVRIARVLIDLAQRCGHRGADDTWTLDVPLTNIELGSIAGLKPRTAEMGFGLLRDAGFVLTGTRRVISIPRLEHLRALVAEHRDPAVTVCSTG